MNAHLAKILCFEAAHRNPLGGPAQQRLHGHSYKVEILASGAVDADIGWVVDFAELKRLFGPLNDILDHACLNDLPGFEQDTSLSGVKHWIEDHVRPWPAWFQGVTVSILGDLAYRPRRREPEPVLDLPERIHFSFEAAQSLPQLPKGHPCRNLHGHSYHVEVAVKQMQGLETRLRALYDTLDHQFLNEIPGLGFATSERICAWIWTWLQNHGENPAAIVVQETPSARCVYFGD